MAAFANGEGMRVRRICDAAVSNGIACARPGHEGLPSRSSFEGDQARLRVASRRYGAASFAWSHERRMVDQNSASWNRIVGWLRQIDLVRLAA